MKIHLAYSTKLALDEIGNYETESRGIVDIAVSTMLYNYDGPAKMPKKCKGCQ